MARLSGGEVLARSLVREGVEVVFGPPGIQTYGLVAGLRNEPAIPPDLDPPRAGHHVHGRRLCARLREARRGAGRAGVGLYNAASGLATAYARPAQLREAARVIAAARLPLIYAGGGVARSDAEDALVRLAEATNIPVVTSSGGKGTIPDSHPLSYGSCFSPRGERQEMNQLFEVMQAADVVIGIGGRFSLGNPAGNASSTANVVTVVFRNDSYGNVARDLDLAFGGAYGTDLHNPDFVAFAESFGAVGMRAADPMELGTLLPAALERDAAVVIDVPFGDMPIPRAPQFAPVYELPRTQPQDGLIES